MRMFTRYAGHSLAALAMLAATITPLRAQEAAAPAAPAAPATARITLWFDAQFDAQGQVSTLAPAPGNNQPDGLLQPLMEVIRKSTRITPMQEEGQPATFRTGMRVVLALNEQGRPTRLLDLKMTPLLLEEYVAPISANLSAGRQGWDGSVQVSCTVATSGKCGEIVVKAHPGMPEAVRRWARSSLAGYRFQPQEINGKPITAEVVQTLNLSISDDGRPADFRDGRRI